MALDSQRMLAGNVTGRAEQRAGASERGIVKRWRVLAWLDTAVQYSRLVVVCVNIPCISRTAKAKAPVSGLTGGDR